MFLCLLDNKLAIICVCADPEGSHLCGEDRLPAGGRAADQPSARAHSEVLRRLCRWRSAYHGLRVHETRRPQQVPQVCGCYNAVIFVLCLCDDRRYEGNWLLLIEVTDQVEDNYGTTEFQCDALGISRDQFLANFSTRGS